MRSLFCLLQGQVSFGDNGVTLQDNPEYVTVVASVLPIQFMLLGEANHVDIHTMPQSSITLKQPWKKNRLNSDPSMKKTVPRG